MSKPALEMTEVREFARAAELMNEVWKAPSWRYSDQLLTEYLGRGEFCCAVGAEVAGELVGFIGGMPFSGRIGNLPLNGIFTSFFTAHPKASVYGVSTRLLSGLVDQAKSRGAEWYVTLLEANKQTQPLIEALHRRAGLAVKELLRIEFWVGGPRFLQLESEPLKLERFTEDALGQCRALLVLNAPAAGIAHVPTEKEFRAIFGSKEPAWLWRERGQVLACVVLRRREVRASVARTNLHGDWVLFAPELDRAQRARFLRSALSASGLEDISMVVLPRVGSCDADLLREVRFLQGPRNMALCAAHLHDKTKSLEPVQSALVEVY